MPLGDLRVRPAATSDRGAILELATRALGWAGDERDRAFFSWKHDDNPFGASPSWVAIDGERVVGFRTFLCWELGRGDDRLRMVRAVDTATDPEYQGRGIFRDLTLRAVDELGAGGVDAVFNTPNAQSRPGYLKMGWVQLGRPTLFTRPATVAAGLRMARSRGPGAKWSEPVAVGESARSVLADPSIDALVSGLPRPPGWSTPRTAAYLRWRYGLEPLHYRVIEVADGIAVFRVRRRGPNLEVGICEWLASCSDRRALRRLVREAGDYALGIGLGARHGLVPLPRQGPIVTWRPLARPEIPRLGDLRFGLGDLELF